MDVDEIRREDLNHLLTTCRARIDPVAVHLGQRPGHRGPGLRQNDVAALAGVSARWYATLERGDHDAPSPGMLRRVAAALHMTETERERLFLLAETHCEGPRLRQAVPVEQYRELLRRLEPGRAALFDHAMNLVDATADFRTWLGTSTEGPWVNALTWAFGPVAAQRFADVDRLRDTAVAVARELRVRRPFDVDVAAALEALLALPGITAHWHSQDAALVMPVAAHKVVAEDGGVHEMLATTTRLAGGWSLFVMYEPTVAG
ncbi:helix-turn-helix domain-containing protein [Embleya sp. NBC_00896]|uniref:helix-turn-helix domain-containing protein n=1 Tax=Embleya sp. NBC_00896 TaxID=2975961 RepID=UPI002F910408|nr:helix-turn-helix domain-containing protein [Embleya sp. NBC_00896]